MIDRNEIENSLVAGTIRPATIRSRIQRNNVVGINKMRIPVLNNLEPLIVQWCIKMSQIVISLTRENVKAIVNDMITGTSFETQFKEYNKKCKCTKKGNGTIGISWYNRFMSRHKLTLKRGRCKPRDINRFTWCTLENFMSMYDGVYNAMVGAGIAE
jgi:hypothetical protein